MEFTRRGAADAAADGRRFPDPPPHEDAMGVTRDALLLQLQRERLRQEIIVDELAKIERAMHAAAAGDQAAPLPRLGVAGDDAWSEFGEEFMWPQRRGPIGDRSEVPGNNDAVPGKPSMGDRSEECSRPRRCEGNAAFGEQNLPVSNGSTVPPEKATPVVKWELTGITIPVKKPKSKQTWDCAVCQVRATSERNLQEHCAGQKHKSNVAILGLQTEAADQVQRTKSTAEPSTGTAQKWSCSICRAICTSEVDLKKHLGGERHREKMRALCEEGKNMAMDFESQKAKLGPNNVPQHAEKMILTWCCSICQARCTCESDLEKHLRGGRHRAKIEALFEEGKNMAKNSEPWKAKMNLNNVPRHAEKTASSWSCSVCQAHCTSESDLKKHLKGERHRVKIQALNEEGPNMAKNSESQKATLHQNNVPQRAEKTVSRWSCSICQAHCTCESDLQNHLRGWRHQLNIQALRDEANQDMSHPPDFAKIQNELWEWSCSLCQATCNSESQFVNHCMSSKHQEKLQALQGEDSKNSKGSRQKETNVPSDEPNSKKPSSEKVDKQKELYLCKACDVRCNSEKMLTHHRAGKKHADKVGKLKELGFCEVCDLQCNSKKVLVDHQNGKKHLENVAKQKAPYFCEVCKLQCSTEKMLTDHRYGKKHRAKLDAKK